MSSFALTALETRVLGCLIEKEHLTPENYPLSLHSVTTACNQSTNRHPVVSYEEKAVEAGLNALREKKLASVIFGAGSRVQKYRHKLLEHYTLSPSEVALLCVLMLRGPQTPGELRSRTERMHAFDTVAEVQSLLDELGRTETALIRVLPARPGQKERRYVQLFSEEVAEETDESAGESVARETGAAGGMQPTRTDVLTKEIAELRTDLDKLREEFAAFRRQFE